MADTLADRLNHIIERHNITKREFARRIGVGENYVYVLTGGGRNDNRNVKISPALARVIGAEFKCDPEWILNGENAAVMGRLSQSAVQQVEKLSPD